MTEQLTTAEHNVIKAYDKMKKLHENFRIVADAEATARKGFNRAGTPTNLPTGSGDLSFEDEDPTLAAYIEVVDRVQVGSMMGPVSCCERCHAKRASDVRQCGLSGMVWSFGNHAGGHALPEEEHPDAQRRRNAPAAGAEAAEAAVGPQGRGLPPAQRGVAEHHQPQPRRLPCTY